MRVMAYEARLIGLKIARDEQPVFLVGRGLFSSTANIFNREKKYASVNPLMILPPELRKLAVTSFSGRYDLRRTLSDNFEKPKHLLRRSRSFKSRRSAIWWSGLAYSSHSRPAADK